MDENYRNMFQKALEYLLAKKGRGAIQTLSIETGLSQSAISSIKTGARAGKIETLQTIAKGLGTSYEEMLALGRQLQEGHQDISTPLAAVRQLSPDDPFCIALNNILKQKGDQYLPELATASEMPEEYIKKLTQAQTGISEENKLKIARAAGFDSLEAFEALGRHATNGSRVVYKIPELEFDPDKSSHAPDADPRIAALIEDVRDILRSGNAAAIEALERSIACFKQSVETERRLMVMEKRMVWVEKRIKTADSRLRKNDDPAQKDRIIKKRVM